MAPLERILRFRTTGSVSGYEVQRARLALRGETIAIFALRDGSGIVRLALAERGDVPCRRRLGRGGIWEADLAIDPGSLAALLRRNGYLPAGFEPEGRRNASQESHEVRAIFSSPDTRRIQAPAPGERILPGVKVSPGRAAGIALFGTVGRRPEDLDGAILIAPSLSPEENAYIYRCSAIVSTGGGILSHAGLLAVQFRKPSLMVAGRWDMSGEGATSLRFSIFDYEETEEEIDGLAVVLRKQIREKEGVLREGDLVVVDADLGTVQVLGQDRDALVLHEELRQLRETGVRLAETESDAEVLALRGRRLRARHQLERLLLRIEEESLARHAVWELLIGELSSGPGATRGEKAGLLRALIENPAVGRVAGDSARACVMDLDARFTARHEEALRSMPELEGAYEVLSLRLGLLRLRETLESVRRLLEECGLGAEWGALETESVERLAGDRVRVIRARLLDRLRSFRGSSPPGPRGSSSPPSDREARGRGALSRPETGKSSNGSGSNLRRRTARPCAKHRALGSCAPVTEAWSSAHRSVRRPRTSPRPSDCWAPGMSPSGSSCPTRRSPRFSTRRRAPDSPSLRHVIGSILARPEMSDAQKAFLIRKLWEGLRLPEDLETELLDAYRQLGTAGDPLGESFLRPRRSWRFDPPAAKKTSRRRRGRESSRPSSSCKARNRSSSGSSLRGRVSGPNGRSTTGRYSVSTRRGAGEV